MKSKRFSRDILDAIHKSKIFGIRAGTTHRFIGVWPVVTQGRVFIRSWTLKPGGWYRTFLEDPRGMIQVGDREIPIRAVQIRSEAVKDAVTQAYFDKFNTPGALKYTRGFAKPKHRDTTTELVPLEARGARGEGRAEGRRRKAESGKRKAEGGKQKAESGRQKAEGGRQKTESRKQKADSR